MHKYKKLAPMVASKLADISFGLKVSCFFKSRFWSRLMIAPVL